MTRCGALHNFRVRLTPWPPRRREGEHKTGKARLVSERKGTMRALRIYQQSAGHREMRPQRPVPPSTAPGGRRGHVPSPALVAHSPGIGALPAYQFPPPWQGPGDHAVGVGTEVPGSGYMQTARRHFDRQGASGRGCCQEGEQGDILLGATKTRRSPSAVVPARCRLVFCRRSIRPLPWTRTDAEPHLARPGHCGTGRHACRAAPGPRIVVVPGRTAVACVLPSAAGMENDHALLDKEETRCTRV